MPGNISPDVALAAVALRRKHPDRSAREVLDECMRGRTGRVGDFGGAVRPGHAFAALVAEEFGSWQQFAESYGLTI